MENKDAESLAALLGKMHIIPVVYDSFLFSEEVYDMTGFQIKCTLNKVGRLVYSVYDVEHDICLFQIAYEKEFGSEMDKKSKGNVDKRKEYPATGSDSLNDLSPSTIASLLRVSESDNDDEDNTIALFLLQISDVIESWSKQCEKMHNDTKLMKEVADQIYDNVL
ncbi:hypothetical protein HN499_05200 [archaeon]|jgi:hypothetical protein|nr:hypothetical protein [archaeon]